MTSKLKRKFFNRPTLMVAKDLLGKFLTRRIGKKILSGKIIETEAYIGPEDRASHGYKMKKTPRNKAEYLIGGHIYIYLVYGMYWQLNISTEKEGLPRCVLIRALEPVIANRHESTTNNTNKGLKFVKICGKLVNIREVANGPGKLCQWLKLDKSFNREDLTKSKRIWLAASNPLRRASRLVSESERAPEGRENYNKKISPNQIVAVKRIGIDYAGKYWANQKWRFYIRNSQFISKR